MQSAAEIINNNSADYEPGKVTVKPEAYAALNNKIIAIFLSQLHAAVNDELNMKIACRQASVLRYDFPLFKIRQRLHKSYAKRATKPERLGLEDVLNKDFDFKQTALFETLDYMAYDRDFFGIADSVEKFLKRVLALPSPRNLSVWSHNISDLGHFFLPTNFIGKRFRPLVDLLLAKGIDTDEQLDIVERRVEDNQAPAYAAATQMNITPERYVDGNMAAQAAARHACFYAKQPYSPFVPRKSEDSTSSSDSTGEEEENLYVSYKPDVLAFHQNDILALVQLAMFNPQSNKNYGNHFLRKVSRDLSRLWRRYPGRALGKMSEFASDVDDFVFFGVFKSVSKGASDSASYFYRRYFKSYRPAESETLFTLQTQLVQQAIEDLDSADLLLEMERFRLHWLDKKPSSEQLAKIKELVQYESLLKDEEIKKDVPEANDIAEDFVKKSEKVKAEHKKIKEHLKKSSGMRSFLLRSASTTEVFEYCDKSSEGVVPDYKLIDQLAMPNIYNQIIHHADHIFGLNKHGLNISKNILGSSDIDFQYFLSAVTSARMSPSRKYIFLLLGLAIRAVDPESAEAIKHVFYQSRGERNNFYQRLMACPALPNKFKVCLPKWSGLFLPSDEVTNSFNTLKPKSVLVATTVRQLEIISELEEIESDADLAKPKTAREIDALTTKNLHFYAEEVCHEITTVGPLRSKKKSIHKIIDKILDKPEFILDGHQSLKFLLAILEWYLKYKLEAKYYASDEMVLAYQKIHNVKRRIENYLRGDTPAIIFPEIKSLFLNELLDIDYKNQSGHSFHKLLTFVSLKYEDEEQDVVYDLETKFIENENERAIQRAKKVADKIAEKKAKRQLDAQKPSWFKVSIFGQSSKVAVDEHSNADVDSPGRNEDILTAASTPRNHGEGAEQDYSPISQGDGKVNKALFISPNVRVQGGPGGRSVSFSSPVAKYLVGA